MRRPSSVPRLRHVLSPVVATIRAERVLDVASGDGRAVALLGELGARFERVYRVDPELSDSVDPEPSDTASGFAGTVESWLDDAASDSGEFDLLVIADGLHYLGDPAATVRRLGRMVRAGGWMVIWEPVSDFAADPRHAAAYTVHRIKASIDRAVGISHGELLSIAEVRGYMDALPVDWTLRGVLSCETVESDAVVSAIDATIDYARLIAGRRAAYAATVRTLRSMTVDLSRACGAEVRTVWVGRRTPAATRRETAKTQGAMRQQ